MVSLNLFNMLLMIQWDFILKFVCLSLLQFFIFVLYEKCNNLVFVKSDYYLRLSHWIKLLVNMCDVWYKQLTGKETLQRPTY